MSDSVNELLKAFDKNNRHAFEDAVYIISRIVKTWCSKNLLELTWTTGYIKNQENGYLAAMIWDNLTPEDIRDRSIHSVKSRIIELADEIINNEFNLYIELLKINDVRAWNQLVSVFKIRCASWLGDRVEKREFIRQIFNDALMVLHKDFSSEKKLQFSNSCALKSYLFKILENKIKEHNRENNRLQFELHEREDIETFPYIDSSEDSVKAEQLSLIENSIDQLEIEEQEILRKHYFEGKKLKKIAEELELTEENVRIKKHRAMKRIMKSLRGIEYETYKY